MIFTIEIMNAINTVKVIQQVEKFFFFGVNYGETPSLNLFLYFSLKEYIIHEQ